MEDHGSSVARSDGRPAKSEPRAERHTPGPWFTYPGRQRRHGARAPIFRDGLWVIKGDPDLNPIATVDWADDHDAPTRAMAEANALLITAAPDLLEAARDLEALLREVAPEYADSTVAANARAAIANATTPQPLNRRA